MRLKVGSDLIQVRFPDGTFQRMDAVCGNRSEFIRDAVEAALCAARGEKVPVSAVEVPVSAERVAKPAVKPVVGPGRAMSDREARFRAMQAEYLAADRLVILSWVGEHVGGIGAVHAGSGLPEKRFRAAFDDLVSDGSVVVDDGCVFAS